MSEAARLGITLIRGVEISVEWHLHLTGRTVKAHLLGYWVRDDRGTELYDLLAELREKRHERNLGIIERLKAQGMTVTPQQLPRPESR